MFFQLLVLVATFTSAAFAACESDFEVICYWGTWSYYRKDFAQFTSADINPKLCTTIVYSFFGLNKDFNLDHLDSWLDVDKKAIGDTIALKKDNPCLKVNLAVGGWNEGSIKYSVMAAFEDSRKQFARSALRILTYYGFDGIDLDWEYPTNRGGIAQDKQNFASLLKEIKAAISPWGLGLSVAVGVEEKILSDGYDISSIAGIVDRVHIMAYDYATSISGKTGLSSPFSEIKKTVSLWTSKGLANKKVILGIPAYARSYELTNSSKHGIGDTAIAGAKGPYTLEEGFLAYYEVLYYKSYMDFVEVQTDGTVYAYNENDWFTYENQETVELKANWVKEKKFGGVMVWSIDTDDYRGKYGKHYPLLSAVNDILISK